MFFISSKKLRFALEIFKFLYFDYPFFPPLSTIAWEDDRNYTLNFMISSLMTSSMQKRNLKAHFV